MNLMTIRLDLDPKTGKKNITVQLQSDSDVLPHEHENMHRDITNKLLEGGLVSQAELGNITVERGEKTPPQPVEPSRQQERQPTAQKG